MFRQTHSDRLRWWATLLEGRTIADRQHGWSGLWLSSDDAAALVHTLREAAAQAGIDLDAAPVGGRGGSSGDDDWPETQPGGWIDDEPPEAGAPAARALPPAAGVRAVPAALHASVHGPVHARAARAAQRPTGGLRLLNPLRQMLR